MTQYGQQPSSAHNVLWWLMYTILGIWAQHVLPGVDFLLPGVILSMQEENRSQTLWLTILYVLIQDGSGLMAFGPSVLWYATAAALFFFGRWLFEAKNIVFIMLLACAMGAWHVALAQMMSVLQSIPLDLHRHITEGVWQALALPPCWFFLNLLRARFMPNVNAA